MKKLFIIISLAAALLMVTSSVFAYSHTLTANRYTGYYSGNGGEFTIKLDGVYTFESFCLETNEYISMGVKYFADISSGAINGGVGGSNPDPISIGTARLYSEFFQGTLAGYNYTPGLGRAASAGQLQEAIWYLEEEIAKPANNPFIALVEGIYGANVMDNANGAFGVDVLNIYTSNNAPVQDMLHKVPEPSVLLLLGLGLVGVGIVRRKS